MATIAPLSEPYRLNGAASPKALMLSLSTRLMRLEALAHIGVNELLLESAQWDSPTVHHFSLLAELSSQCREIYEALLLKQGQAASGMLEREE